MSVMPGADSHGGGPVAAINVTPMADVIITLLIIFMVMTPLLDQADRVRLPEAESGRSVRDADQVVVRVRDDGTVLLEGRPIGASDLLAVELREERGAASRSPRRIRVEADASLDYAQVARVLDACREAGVGELLLRTRPRALRP